MSYYFIKMYDENLYVVEPSYGYKIILYSMHQQRKNLKMKKENEENCL